MKYTENDIAMLLKEGKEEALAILFARYHKSLVYFGDQLIGNNVMTEDFVAKAFVEVWKRREEFKTTDNVKAFLFVLVRHSCYSYVKHLKRRKRSHTEIAFMSNDSENFIEAKMIKAELIQVVINESKNLPTECKKVSDLFFFSGLKIIEISDRLGITVDTARVQKARALNFIRKRVAI